MPRAPSPEPGAPSQEPGRHLHAIMELTPGARFGAFEIVGHLGSGGMGDVYRARDTRLNRDVALKLLPAEYARDADRVARFTREAQVLASLAHPNIAVIHGVEEHDGRTALVLELIEGSTLADRIEGGAMPAGEAISLATQVADALDAAHVRGIVHRDLKPANVKVTPGGVVKVLDFGLAKALSEPARVPHESMPPTALATHAGVIVGTPAYMSPEQAKGKPADRQSDIWAFGCLLFELLTGRRAFPGDSMSEVIAKVLEREPDWTLMPSTAPPVLFRVVRRCLDRDPRRRFHDIADVRTELEDMRETAGASLAAGASAAPRRLLAVWTLAGLLTAASVVTAVWALSRRPTSPTRPTHVQIELPAGVSVALDTPHPALAVSPDGSAVVYVGEERGVRRLYVRRLSERESHLLTGSEDAASPFFSPDGAWVGFYQGNYIARVSLAGGVPLRIVATTSASVSLGATWTEDGMVVFAPSANGGLRRASMHVDRLQAAGSAQTLATSNLLYAWPTIIPGVQQVLVTDRTSGLKVASAALSDGSLTSLINGASAPRYSATRHVLFTRDNALYAVGFDARALKVVGSESKLLDGVMTHVNGAAQYGISQQGVLAFVAGGEVRGEQELVWVDRHGQVGPLFDQRQTYLGPRLSPDGRQLAFGSWDGANLDVWRLDLSRGAISRLTTHGGEDFGPVWSPDGQRLAIVSEVGEDNGEPGPAVAWLTATGGPTEQLLRSPRFGEWEFPNSWSPDGKWIAFVRSRDAGLQHDDDVMVMATDGPRETKALLEGASRERAAMFSPNGRWMAYASDESGRFEVYVTPFPGPGPRTPVSTDGGVEPLWSRDGRELYYRENDRLMAADFRGAADTIGRPRVLFEGRFEKTAGMGGDTANYDVAPDGRFVMVRRKHLQAPTTIQVVLNWPALLPSAAR